MRWRIHWNRAILKLIKKNKFIEIFDSSMMER